MDLATYVTNTPNKREELIKELAEITCSDVTSVYRWINGRNTPPAIKQKLIAEHLGVTVEELFPSPGTKEAEK